MRHQYKRLITAIAFLLVNGIVFSQKDSLVMTNGDFMVGEIKSMDKGVLFIETPYSDNDFNVKWAEIKEVFSTTRFLVTLEDGRRLNSTINTNEAGKIMLVMEDQSTVEASMNELVNLIGLKSEFWCRAHASVDLGFSFTQANHI